MFFLVVIFLPLVSFGATTTPQGSTLGATGALLGAGLKTVNPVLSGESFINFLDVLIEPLFKSIGQALMLISSGVLILTGWIFDMVVETTITNVNQYFGSQAPMGQSISKAWGTLRDLANMAFIFVLLYAAFKAMFDANFGEAGKTIKNIIIIALLINFSLFFTKVVIDASNVISLGFYRAIASSNEQTLKANERGQSVFGSTSEFKGISGGYMRMLGLQTFYSADILDKQNSGVKVLALGVFSSIFMLVSSVIFLISGVMFAARFIILVFLMILSPLAFVAYTVPGGSGQFNKWVDALKEQALFAPVFFALTWVAFQLGNTLVTPEVSWVQAVTGTDVEKVSDVKTLLLNFTLLIGFSIAALVFSKQMVKSTPRFKEITGGIGSAAIGGTAFLGRQTIGRGANMISEKYRDKLSKTSYGRAGLWLADKARNKSFDARSLADTGIGKAIGANKVTDILGKAGGSGGFKKSIDEKAKEKADYAKRVYGQTDEEKRLAKERKQIYEKEKENATEEVRKQREKEASDKAKERDEYLESKTKEEAEEQKKIEKELEDKKKELDQAIKEKKVSDQLIIEREIEEIKKNKARIDERLADKIKEIKKSDEKFKELDKEAKEASDKAKEKDIRDEELLKELVGDQKDIFEKAKKAYDSVNMNYKKRMEEYAKRLEGESPVITSAGTAIGMTIGTVLGGPIGFIAGSALGAWAGKKSGSYLPPNKGWAGNKAAAAAVRKASGDKSLEEQAAEILKKMEAEKKKNEAKKKGEENEGGEGNSN